MNIRALALLLLIFMTGCSEKEPADKKTARAEVQFDKFVGHWEAKTEVAGLANGFDNTAIIFGMDGMVEYKHCSARPDAAATRGQGLLLSKLVVSEIGNGVLALSKPATPYYAEKKFKLDREPYEQAGNWYLELDGIKLRKLEAGEASDYASWQCP